MITDLSSLSEWKTRAAAQPQGRTVLDLEADSLHRHLEKLCLIQYGDAEGVDIIDPLAIEDMRLFVLWMQQADVWMHGADYDMSLLLHAYGELPHLILDTQIAARLLGHRKFGLAALVEHFYGVKLSKKNQKANWGLRPIPPEMQEYAQGDVTYMLGMADQLVAQLQNAGRYEWFIESCIDNMTHGRERFAAGTQDPWRIKGSGKLNRRGLAALRCLWYWRDREAAQQDRPAFMICANEDLLRWSFSLQEFRAVYPLSHFYAHRAARFRKAIDAFQLMDEDDYPELPKRERHMSDPHFDTKLEYWLTKRNNIAEQLNIENMVLASRSEIESIANNEERGLSRLMTWQRNLLLS